MFGNFIGQERWQHYFEQTLEKGSLAHGYLFSGPAHIGKMTFILDLARVLVCGEKKSPCQTCVSCRAWQEQKHPDCVQLAATDKDIGVEDVREFIVELHRRPTVGRYRVALVADADRLTPAAANALLRIMEEPPKQVVVLARAVNASALPATLRSRFQRCRFIPVGLGELAKGLEAHGLSRGAASEFARLAEGCPGRAFLWGHDAAAAEAYRQEAREFVEALQGSLAQRFALTEMIATEERCSRRELNERLDHWVSVLRDMYLVAANVPERIVHESLRGNYETIVRDNTTTWFANACQRLLEAQQQVAHFANRRLAINTFFLHV